MKVFLYKLCMASVLTVLHEIIRWIVAKGQPLVELDVGLVFLVVAFVIVDFITAIMASRRRGVKLESKIARRTLTKVIQYTIFVAVLNAFGHGFSGLPFVGAGLSATGAFALFIVASAEVWSIIENIGAQELMQKLRAAMGSRKLPGDSTND